MNEAPSIRVSFSLYPADVAALGGLVKGLGKAGVPVREATVLRALIHLSPAAEMLARATAMADSLAKQGSKRDADYVVDHPTTRLPKADVAKLDWVADELTSRGTFEANRAFVVRALLRAAPAGSKLAPAVRQFLTAFPNKPRGISKLRLERKGRSHD